MDFWSRTPQAAAGTARAERRGARSAVGSGLVKSNACRAGAERRGRAPPRPPRVHTLDPEAVRAGWWRPARGMGPAETAQGSPWLPSARHAVIVCQPLLSVPGRRSTAAAIAATVASDNSILAAVLPLGDLDAVVVDVEELSGLPSMLLASALDCCAERGWTATLVLVGHSEPKAFATAVVGDRGVWLDQILAHLLCRATPAGLGALGHVHASWCGSLRAVPQNGLGHLAAALRHELPQALCGSSDVIITGYNAEEVVFESAVRCAVGLIRAIALSSRGGSRWSSPRQCAAPAPRRRRLPQPLCWPGASGRARTRRRSAAFSSSC
mmetsp:Transcript_1016/g.3770  ORF Transcript_1016/g.3770 Transcript_1016/m.3770 type:complete len:325 (-) Transcript_1016:787-1761(-)